MGDKEWEEKDNRKRWRKETVIERKEIEKREIKRAWRKKDEKTDGRREKEIGSGRERGGREKERNRVIERD